MILETYVLQQMHWVVRISTRQEKRNTTLEMNILSKKIQKL